MPKPDDENHQKNKEGDDEPQWRMETPDTRNFMTKRLLKNLPKHTGHQRQSLKPSAANGRMSVLHWMRMESGQIWTGEWCDSDIIDDEITQIFALDAGLYWITTNNIVEKSELERQEDSNSLSSFLSVFPSAFFDWTDYKSDKNI